MRFQLITQIILIIVSVVIILTVIKPEFTELRLSQDRVSEYKESVANATDANNTLNTLVQRKKSFTPFELNKLNIFLPTEIDSIAVSRDIQNIVEKNALFLQDVTFKSTLETNQTEVQNQIRYNGEIVRAQSLLDVGKQALLTEQFSVDVVGSYVNMKRMLQDFERNVYPLRLVTLEFSSEEDSAYTFKLLLETYALNDDLSTDSESVSNDIE